MTRTVRRSLAASVAALSLLVLAGCGGNDDDSASDGGSGSSTSASASTSESAEAESSETAESEGDEGQAAGEEISGEEFSKVIQTAIDEATTANVTISTGAAGGVGGIEGTGQIDYEADPAEVKMTATIAQAGDIEMILVGTKLYLKGAAFGAGDKWVELPLDDPNSPLGAIGDQLDPAASLQKLTKGIQTATFVGEEDVDGDTLDHYTATVDTKVLLEDLPPEAQGSSGLPATVDYDMWFDEDGLFRKFSVEMGSLGTSEGTFSDWGTDVDIEAPPASEITSMPGM